MREIRRAPAWVKGLTLSGGEPFQQAGEMAELARRAREKGYHVTTYTGYRYEELAAMAQADAGAIDALLAATDLLVDGPFIAAAKDIALRFRGSANQRLIDMAASRREGGIVLLPEEPARPV
jgi:anaerobic ribonucleoside-triphosphate reductase activating protein